MFILGEIFGSLECKESSKMFYIFNLLIKNVVKSGNGFIIIQGGNVYEGDINELCVHFYKAKVFDDKYN